MAKYNVSWLEEKTTSTGKNKYDLSLIDEKGQQVDKVTMWGDHPSFVGLKPGSVIEGDIVTKGDWKTIYPTKTKPSGQGSFAPNRGFSGGKAMVAEKAKNIAEAQQRKNDSIMTSATFRDATILTQAELSGKTEDEIKEVWTKWRFWLAEQFDKDMSDFKQPF